MAEPPVYDRATLVKDLRADAHAGREGAETFRQAADMLERDESRRRPGTLALPKGAEEVASAMDAWAKDIEVGPMSDPQMSLRQMAILERGAELLRAAARARRDG